MKKKLVCPPSKLSSVFSKIKDNCLAIIAIASVISLLFAVNTYFAKAHDLKMVELRLDKKIMADEINSIDRRIWTIKERHGEDPKDKTIREELRDLENKKKERQKELDKK